MIIYIEKQNFFNLSSIFTVGTIIYVIMGGHRYVTQTIFGLRYPARYQTLKEFYLNLPSARNSFHKPCCIFCGHHSFYKKGVYQTDNDRLVYCAKCDNYLYDETQTPWYRLW